MGNTFVRGASPSVAPMLPPIEAPPQPASPKTSLYQLINEARAQIEGPNTGSVDQGSRSLAPSSALQLRCDGVTKPRKPAQLTGWNFDWDDNIFFMPTKIRLYHKETGEDVGVSTADFALIREEIGKPGK